MSGAAPACHRVPIDLFNEKLYAIGAMLYFFSCSAKHSAMQFCEYLRAPREQAERSWTGGDGLNRRRGAEQAVNRQRGAEPAARG